MAAPVGDEFTVRSDPTFSAEEALYGDQGDDRIFSGSIVTGDVLVSGGTGDDYLIGG